MHWVEFQEICSIFFFNIGKEITVSQNEYLDLILHKTVFLKNVYSLNSAEAFQRYSPLKIPKNYDVLSFSVNSLQ